MLQIIEKDDIISIEDSRKCCICGSSSTYIYDYREIWYDCHCNKKGCTKDLCSVCYSKIKNARKDSHKNIKKQLADSRIGNLTLSDEIGKSLIDQAVVAKFLNIEDLNISTDNLKCHIDMFHDFYKRIDVKSAFLKLNNWGSEIWEYNNKKKKDCDTFICLGYDKDRKNILAVYVVPNNDYIKGLNKLAIPKNTLRRLSMYDKYKVSNLDIESYNKIYLSIISCIGDKKYFGIEDIKNWSKN